MLPRGLLSVDIKQAGARSTFIARLLKPMLSGSALKAESRGVASLLAHPNKTPQLAAQMTPKMRQQLAARDISLRGMGDNADAIATSGRHKLRLLQPNEVSPDTVKPISDVIYKGMRPPTGMPAPTGIGGGNEFKRPYKPATGGAHWTSLPQVAAEYGGAGVARSADLHEYVLKSRQSLQKEYGAHSGDFAPHMGDADRRLMPNAYSGHVDNTVAKTLASQNYSKPNTAGVKMPLLHPYFEWASTRPNTPDLRTWASELYKQLPSGKDYQRTFGELGDMFTHNSTINSPIVNFATKPTKLMQQASEYSTKLYADALSKAKELTQQSGQSLWSRISKTLGG